jgi:UDP-glucose 4-epimerase
MEDVSSRPIPTKQVDRRPGDVGICVAAATRSLDELGWKTEKSLRDACADIWNFLKVSGLSSQR